MAGNEAVINIRATGGAAVQEQIDRVRQSLEKTKKSALESSEGFKKVGNAFENLATDAIGLNGPLGQLGEGIIAFAPGGPLVVGALAGLTLIAGGIKKLEDAAKDTKTANNELAKSIAALSGESEEFAYQQALNTARFAQEALQTYNNRGGAGKVFTQLFFGNPEAEAARATNTVINAVAALNKKTDDLANERKTKEEQARKDRESKYKEHTNTLKKLEADRLKDLLDETKMTYAQVYALESLKSRSPDALAKAGIKKSLEDQTVQDAFYRAEVNRLLNKSLGFDPSKKPTLNAVAPIDINAVVASVQAGFDQFKQQMGGGPLFGQFAGLASSMEDSIAESFGTAIANGFERAFVLGNPVELIRGFGSVLSGALAQSVNEMAMTWLGGIGKMFARQAAAYLKFGSIMKGLSKFLTNPFTAGVAAAAIGAALFALSRSLGSQAQGVTGNGYGSPSSVDYGTTQQGLAKNGAGEATIVIQGGLLDMSNPEQARSFANALETLSGRRVTVLRG